MHEIVLPETEPETEWVRGRALQKVSPKRDHGRLQAKFAIALDAWATGRGEVATEWRFRVEPPGDVRRPLVPDVAYVAADRLRGHSHDALQAPPFAPTVAVEIVSPGDRRLDLESKIDVYLRAGARLVIIVDPQPQTIELHETGRATTFPRNDVLHHEALPGFTLDVGTYFDSALRLIDNQP